MDEVMRAYFGFKHLSTSLPTKGTATVYVTPVMANIRLTNKTEI